VSEDEGFVRAIVDSPADDMARLVSAVWLEDRDDPRCPYLRAELEWARPWQSGERPKDDSELRQLVAELAPQWVARLSRPPVGVCCEHVRFEGVPRRVEEADLAAAEQVLGLPLPVEYRAFLLNCNGGRPAPVPSSRNPAARTAAERRG
jgi:uncharacterized protein (TIGR02996 family)